jgi:hypothetical protein
MNLEVDHIFVACASAAPEGDALLRLGLIEGSRNTHPGQGTANRRFFFENFMLELIWVADPAEATSQQTRRTRLWERCSKTDSQINPFGIIFRVLGEDISPAPFKTWSYHPSYLPPTIAIEIAEGTTLQEPELFISPFVRPTGIRSSEPIDHVPPLRHVCGLRVGVPNVTELSEASSSAEKCGLLTYFESQEHVIEILFANAANVRFDLRPTLPLLFCGT